MTPSPYELMIIIQRLNNIYVPSLPPIVHIWVRHDQGSGLGIYKRKKENTQERKHACVHANTHENTQTRTRTRKRPRKKGLAQEETIMGKKVTKK